MIKFTLLVLSALLFLNPKITNMNSPAQLKISSPAFKQEEMIPAKYTCSGQDINPPLHIDGIPGHCQTLAMIMDDPDAPRGTYYHWVVWNIPPQATIEENSQPGLSGMTSFGKKGYGGPCPPSGTHRYYFKVYALDAKLNLPDDTDHKKLEEAIKGHVLAQGELMGKFSKQ
jgi:Raf kinase inhibitor-like YbhB/YbcL family protein